MATLQRTRSGSCVMRSVFLTDHAWKVPRALHGFTRAAHCRKYPFLCQNRCRKTETHLYFYHLCCYLRKIWLVFVVSSPGAETDQIDQT